MDDWCDVCKREYCALETLKRIIVDRDNLEKDLRALGIE